MDKKGSLAIQELMFEISSVAFAVLISLPVLYFVVSYTKDTSFQAKIYAKDIAFTLETMQFSKSNIKVNYNLPNNFVFNLDEKYVYIDDSDISDIKIKKPYKKNKNSLFKFERKNNNLILEKNEKLS